MASSRKAGAATMARLRRSTVRKDMVLLSSVVAGQQVAGDRYRGIEIFGGHCLNLFRRHRLDAVRPFGDVLDGAAIGEAAAVDIGHAALLVAGKDQAAHIAVLGGVEF